ncbi:substrate-binding domain-containing protein [Lichenihabitans sp. PAMC28606]|uniref:substrate-binding domain-containing protein n=1 Tax=Lichenihabitans sp. PAMC28606 TaxID=2880932 RepID=UPI001D09E59D|nr:substrate-binding domain-containing protein [Lichenihabitans sp. PAMC28606]UDL93128.1 substrate-binding domain-containing protein [Lichenihabitans sp. PAMC28606]
MGAPLLVAGLGPHGERAAPSDRIVLSDADVTFARERAFKVAVVLHTTESDWAKQQLAGMGAILRDHAAAITAVVDCGFSLDRQAQALNHLAGEKLDGVISIPLGNSRAVTDAYRAVSAAGKNLVLLDNAPVGLMPASDYVSVVSADNFGLGEIAAAQLSPYVPQGGKIGLVAFRLGFFATTQREISFRRWIERHRPDVVIRQVKFEQIDHIESLVGGFLDANTDTAALFAVWDGPALRTMRAVERRSRSIPMTTVDLGRDIATALAGRRLIKGVAAQRPFDQGRTAANVLLSSLAGNTVPSWIVLPGLPVTASNVIDAFQQVWHAPPPARLLAALECESTEAANDRTAGLHK